MPIDEDLEFQRRTWRVQRLGWGVLLVTLAVALSGVLGNGPLATAEAAGGGGGLTVEFDRFARADAPTSLALRAAARAAPAETIVIELSRDWLRAIRLEAVIPEPQRVVAAGERIAYEFEVVPGDAVEVRFQIQYDEAGLHEAEARIAGDLPARFRQVVYP